MLDGFLGREPSLAHQLVDERVVVGEPQQLPVAQAVRAAVADVRDRDVALADVDRGQGRAHARLLGVGMGELVDARVGGLRRAGRAPPPARARRADRRWKASTASFEATSPACAPPMPSATTNSGERTISESSFARRWRPVSLPEYCSATRSI